MSQLRKKAAQKKLSSRSICINEYRQENSCHKHKIGKCNFRHDLTESEKTSPSLREKMDAKWQQITGGNSKLDRNCAKDAVKNEKSVTSLFIEEFRSFMVEIKNLVGKPGPSP